MSQNLTSTSKFLSLILRHKPVTIGLQLDNDGWVEIDQVISQANQQSLLNDLLTIP